MICQESFNRSVHSPRSKRFHGHSRGS